MSKISSLVLNKKFTIILLVSVFIFFGISSKAAASSSVQIWNSDASAWTNTLASGTPVDTGIAQNALTPQVATDSNGRVYTVFQQSNGSASHIYLSRHDGTDVKIWNGDASAWTNNFASGTPIDLGTANNANAPQLAIDANNNVYVIYQQTVSFVTHIYLSRYNGTDVRIWDGNTSLWTTTFANGTPIDTGISSSASSAQLAIDSNNKVYLTYFQFDGVSTHIYLSRYDGTDVRIWNGDASAWTNTFASGTPVDTGTANSSSEPQLIVDSTNKVYLVYSQSDGAKSHIYLSRYDGTDVRIWDSNSSSWTTTFANGDPIDTGTANDAYSNQLAVDGAGRVYITYQQSNGSNLHVYLSRYDGTDVRIWDGNTSSWTTAFANGTPIDTGIAQSAITPQVAVDSTGRVYVTYYQSNGTKNHIYLSRYNGTDVRIWDNGASTWTTTFANGDPIDTGIVKDATVPQLAIDTNGKVYVTYQQYTNVNPYPQIYLSRYDGTDVRIWNGDASAWTNTFASGTPIDLGVAHPVSSPQIAVDLTNNIYVTYPQYNSAFVSHVYLSRYNSPTAHTITISAGPNGTISPSGVTSLDDGASQVYTITPSANYHTVDVLIDGVSVGPVASYGFTNVTTAHSIAATFAINVSAQPAVSTQTFGQSSSGSIIYGCKDPKALNYEFFASSSPALCRYSSSSDLQSSQASFLRDLKLGMTGQDVKMLQQFLNNNKFLVAKSGVGSKGKESAKFGPATKAALIKYQKANKITPASGYFGPKTMSVVKTSL
jgi:hypothetical protein